MSPLAFHITWTTYGSWLHGDERNWVESGKPGIQAPDPERKAFAASKRAASAVELTAEQRAIVEQTIRDHCRIRGWTLHALHVGAVHVHVVVTADRAPEEVMNQLKAWTSRRLSDHAGLRDPVAKKAGRKRWWTEHGSTKWINDMPYLHNAIRYVKERQ
jgi:REP element-mobilizing transposase RayT